MLLWIILFVLIFVGIVITVHITLIYHKTGMLTRYFVVGMLLTAYFWYKTLLTDSRVHIHHYAVGFVFVLMLGGY